MAVHPVLEALRTVRAALDAVTLRDEVGRPTGWQSLDGMEAAELREAVALQASLEGRISGLRLHTVAAADAADVAVAEAHPDTQTWAARAGRNRSREWGGVALAKHLEEKYRYVRGALASGRISQEHAAIIVRAIESALKPTVGPDRTPVAEGLHPDDLKQCEQRLVQKAEVMAPDRLRRAARRVLEPLSKELADRHEGEQLAAQERYTERGASLYLTDNGDGSWTGKFVIPELAAIALKTALDRLSGPRRYGRNKAGQRVEDKTMPTEGWVMSYDERLGAAFLELIEHLPETGHAKSSINLVVHVMEEHLRNGVGAATIPTGARISIDEVRRLACEATILPLVMNGASLPLDLGQGSRLFSKAQSVALSAMHEECAAEGCTRPFAWCELHHKIPWSQGGPTDLENAAPLCGFHHRRVHDALFEHRWLPDGSVRFRHRWRSRRQAEDDEFWEDPPVVSSEPAA